MFLLILTSLLSSHDGHWFGGQTQSVQVQLNATTVPVQTLTWRLDAAGAPLASGELPVPADAKQTLVKIEPPTVRAPLHASWSYELRDAAGAAVAKDEAAIVLYPNGILATAARDMDKRKLAILDESDELADMLRDAGVECKVVASLSALQMLSPKLVLIGQDTLPQSKIAQAPIRKLAEHGARIVVLAQNKCEHVAGHEAKKLDSSAEVQWRADHPLLTDLAIESLLGAEHPATAIRLESLQGLDLIGSHIPTSDQPGVDVLLGAERVGKGCIVYCQAPVDDWTSDPRGHVLLRNLLWYVTPAELSEPARSADRAETDDDVPEIRIPSGVKP